MLHSECESIVTLSFKKSRRRGDGRQLPLLFTKLEHFPLSVSRANHPPLPSSPCALLRLPPRHSGRKPAGGESEDANRSVEDFRAATPAHVKGGLGTPLPRSQLGGVGIVFKV